MFPRFSFGLGYLVVLLIVGLLVLGAHFMSGTVPAYSGSATVSGLSGTVDIDRDAYAIPHIHAATEHDAYFGLGYAEAQDRLFQMELERRLGAGRMSELFGPRVLMLDEWSRTIGFARIADQMWLHAGPHTRDVLTAFVAGINAYLSEHRTHLGFTFDALHFAPENWRPQDCLMIGRLMSWEMNFSAMADAAFGDFSLVLDSAHLRSLFPIYPSDGATVIGGANPATFVSNYLANPKNALLRSAPIHQPEKPDTSKRNAQKPSLPPPKHDTLKSKKPKPSHPLGMERNMGAGSSIVEFGTLFREVSAFDSTIRATMGTPMGGGSNAFAISGSHTADGAPLLENDTHLQLESPSRWYLAHLVTDDGMNVAGFLIPGLPAILSGRTADLAWGITNGMADECDYFIEKLDSTGTKYMLPNGTARNFMIIHDTIRVHDTESTGVAFADERSFSEDVSPRRAFQNVPFTIRMTVHGSVLTGMHPDQISQAFHGDARAGAIPDTSIFTRATRPVSMMWNGTYALGDELTGFLALPHAKTAAEARSGMKTFATPCLNLCLADRDGNISYQMIGRLPKRSGTDARQLLPRDGTNPADQWQGFIWTSELPTLTNPARGFLVSANNPPSNTFPVPFGLNWEPSSRADRICELLGESVTVARGARPPADATFAQSVQTDIISSYDLHRVLPYLLNLYPDPDPPSIAPDSISAFRLDSMKLFWKEDSLVHHTSIGDSAMRLVRQKDSAILASHRPRADTEIKTPKVDPFTTEVLEYLRNWDGGMRPEEIAPSIYSVFLNRLIFNTFYDGLGADRYQEFIGLENIPLVTLANVLPDSSNIWWRGTHDRSYIIRLSFQESLRILAQLFGPDIRTWQWGRLHTLTFRHAFDNAGALIARLVDIPAGPMPGGPTTVLQASYDLWNPYAMQVGPSMRMIADMKDHTLYAVLPTGNSEAIFGDHYRDMLPLYQSGALLQLSLDATYDREGTSADLPRNWKRFVLSSE